MPSVETAATVRLKDLTVRYQHRTVIENVSMSLTPGITVLMGPNGVGKSTLLRAIATVGPVPEIGSVEILGMDATDRKSVRAIRRQLGYLPQQYAFNHRLKLREFVTYCALLKGMHTGFDDAVLHVLDLTGITEYFDIPLNQLSGGTLRRAGIAQAIVNDPKILVLDEPTAGLDPYQQERFRSLVTEIARDRTTIYSTHNVEEAIGIAQDLNILNHHSMVRAPEAQTASGWDREGINRIFGLEQ